MRKLSPSNKTSEICRRNEIILPSYSLECQFSIVLLCYHLGFFCFCFLVLNKSHVSQTGLQLAL